MKRLVWLASLATLVVVAVTTTGRLFAEPSDVPHHVVPPSKSGNLVVGLCDGKTSAEMPGVKEGERPTRAQAQAVSDTLMAEWRRKNPNANWDDDVKLAQAVQGTSLPPAPGGPAPAAGGSQPSAAMEPGKPAEGAPEAAKRIEGARTPGEAGAQGATAAGAGGLPAGAQGPVQEGHTYGAFTERDERIWKAATDRFVEEGKKIFHSADELGGTIAVSCDMCHPDGANTHPETYPKFQVQFGRVALLRDMINWCIENPVRGKPLHDDDPKLKAIEAYILATRKGVPLEYGKH
jgi:thiosulfate dehydrogenase